MNYSRIKAFFFDLDGTLRLPDPSPIDAFFQLARTMGMEVSSEKVRQVKLWAFEFWGNDRKIKTDINQLGIQQFWINYSKLLLQQVTPTAYTPKRAQQVTEWFQTKYSPVDHLEPTAYQTLTSLREQGYIIGLISNRTEPLYEATTALGITDLFDFSLAAGEIGVWKPNPNIFWHALSFFPQLSAQDCVYVGDNYFADAVGAKAAGMLPVVFDPEQIYERHHCLQIQTLSELAHLAVDEIAI